MYFCNKKRILFGILNLAILFSLLPCAIVESAIKVDQMTPCISVDPIIDGHINTAEWAASINYNVTLYNLADQNEKLKIQVKTLYSAEGILYFGFIIPDDDNGEGDDYIVTVLRTNTAIDFLMTNPTGGWEYGRYNDLKVVWAQNNHSTDCFTKESSGLTWTADIDGGGVEDSYGKSHPTLTTDEYELRFPLDSADTFGYDPKLNVGDNIHIFFYYQNNIPSPTVYSQILILNIDYSYYDLEIGCTSGTPIPVLSLVLGMLSLSIITMIFTRKK